MLQKLILVVVSVESFTCKRDFARMSVCVTDNEKFKLQSYINEAKLEWNGVHTAKQMFTHSHYCCHTILANTAAQAFLWKNQ